MRQSGYRASASKEVINSVILCFLRNRSRLSKSIALVVLDSFLLAGGVLAAYMLRMSTISLPPPEIVWLVAIGPASTVVACGMLGVYQSISRLRVDSTEATIILAQLPVMAFWSIFILLLGRFGFPRSIIGIFALIAPATMIFARRLVAAILSERALARMERSRAPIVIVGADARGAALYNSLCHRGDRRLVAFAETDADLIGGTLAGTRIVPLAHLPELVRDHGVGEVFVAKSGFPRAQQRRLVDLLRGYPVTIKTLPGLDELVAGRVAVTSSRPLSVCDVLGRDPVMPRGELMQQAVAGKRVLILGAGGSIGSELARQVDLYGPESLVLLDSCEFALFEIHRELEANLRAHNRVMELTAVLGSIVDRELMDEVLTRYGVEVVFHAAAYKHVRLVQENIAAGVVNNVIGTFVAANAARRARVDTFVLISTDKAVRPTSAMGATKRVAEMILQSFSRDPLSRTKFLSVRFGNVLGSSGSVVPIFQKQIEQGGPVTVTHPDVTRYFMLIPEAAQLVIQAAAMARGGEVYVLDMGEPVRIVDLARRMIELAGASVRDERNPEGEIEIRFVGLKEGEKLREELLIDGPVFPTAHQSIMQCRESEVSLEAFEWEIERLTEMVTHRNIDGLKHMIMMLATREAASTPAKSDVKAWFEPVGFGNLAETLAPAE